MTVARKKAAHAQRGKAELNPHDALVLLTAEHNEIDKLAREFERLRKTADTVDKGKAALRLCHAFERYAAIKHEVFYPAADAVLAGRGQGAAGQGAGRARRHPGPDREDREHVRPTIRHSTPTVTVLAEQAGRLMKQEEEELFPRLRHSRLDLLGTGERMAARKTELGTAPIDRERVRQARKVMSGR